MLDPLIYFKIIAKNDPQFQGPAAMFFTLKSCTWTCKSLHPWIYEAGDSGSVAMHVSHVSMKITVAITMDFKDHYRLQYYSLQ